MTGLVPAAGMATRLGGQLKELVEVRGAPIIHASLAQLRRAGVERAVVVIAEHKLELARTLGDGSALGLALAYVMRAPRGLADALVAARSWLAGDACLVLPDTLLGPDDALARICAERTASNADLVLGVFPTDRPLELGPVRVDAGAVVEVLDKPAATDLRNTWGMAAWSPRFTELLVEEAARDPKVVLGAVFQRAIARGLRVRAVPFDDGYFIDIGTPAGLAAAQQLTSK